MLVYEGGGWGDIQGPPEGSAPLTNTMRSSLPITDEEQPLAWSTPASQGCSLLTPLSSLLPDTKTRLVPGGRAHNNPGR